MARWTRDELLLALSLYVETPFGKQHKTYPPIVELAQAIGRTNSAVAMKLCNFTSLDPNEAERGIKGLSGASAYDREIWGEYENDRAKLVDEIESLRERRSNTVDNSAPIANPRPSGETSRTGYTVQRRHQNYFRRVVLRSYGTRCCITGNPIPELLRASHIVPWSESTDHRLDPRNGLCLSATFDAAFDRGLITVSDEYCMVISQKIHSHDKSKEIRSNFIAREGDEITLPEKHLPNLEFLRWHRENIFEQ